MAAESNHLGSNNEDIERELHVPPGCPYLRTFCWVAPVWRHESHNRSPKNIIEEMRLLRHEAGVDLFLFFHIDLESNVLPKLALLRQFGFLPGPACKRIQGRVLRRPRAANRSARAGGAGEVALRFLAHDIIRMATSRRSGFKELAASRERVVHYANRSLRPRSSRTLLLEDAV